MSCNVCKKIKEPIDPNNHGLQYSFSGDEVITIQGFSLLSPLFPPARAPRRGWFFDLYIKGQRITISKPNPRAVALEVMRLLKLNEILYTQPQLWLNLNIQWVARAIEKYQSVKIDDLLAIATKNF